jgi:hypothetical protein
MPERPEDPVLRSSRREALFTILLWVAACAWTVGYCSIHGYGRDPKTLTFVLGFPDWVFWGVMAPWAVCFAATIWFPYRFMKAEDIGAEESEGDDLE